MFRVLEKLLLFAFTILISGWSGCVNAPDGYGVNPRDPELKRIVTVNLKVDKTLINANNVDEIKMEAKGYDEDGREVAAEEKDFRYLVDSTTIVSDEFSTETGGTYALTASINGKVSNTVTVTAIDFFNQDHLHEFEIVISRMEWDGMTQDMKDHRDRFPLNWTENYRTGKYRNAKMIYKGTLDTPLNIEMDNVGIRTKGNTSRVFPQDDDGTYNRFRFKLKFDETFKYDDTDTYRLVKNTEAYQERKKRTFLDFEALGFSFPMFHNPSRINVLFVPQLYEEAGIITPGCVPARITFTIEGTEETPTVSMYYGVFNIVEPVDKKFLTKRFGKESNDGDLYKCLWLDGGPATLDALPSDDNVVLAQSKIIGEKDWTKEYRPTYDIKTNKASTTHSAFKNFIKELNTLNGAELKTYMDDNFEVDRFLRYLALNMLIGDPDQYWNNGNNYFFYCNNNGKYEFIPYDFDHGFGSGWLPLKTREMADESADPDWPYVFDIMNWPCAGKSFINGEDQYINGTIFSMYNLCKAQDFWTEADWGANPVTSKPTDIYTHPLANKLLAIPEYQVLYIQYLKQFKEPGTGIFSYQNFLNCYNHFKSMYNPDAATDYLKNDVDDEDITYMQLTPNLVLPGEEPVVDDYTPIRPLSVQDYFEKKLKAIDNALAIYQDSL